MILDLQEIFSGAVAAEVADMLLAAPVHGRGAYYTPLYRSQRSNYLGR